MALKTASYLTKANSVRISDYFYRCGLMGHRYLSLITAVITGGRLIGRGFWWSYWSATIWAGSPASEIGVSTFFLAIGHTAAGKVGRKRISTADFQDACLSGRHGVPAGGVSGATLAVCPTAATAAASYCTTAPH